MQDKDNEIKSLEYKIKVIEKTETQHKFWEEKTDKKIQKLCIRGDALAGS